MATWPLAVLALLLLAFPLPAAASGVRPAATGFQPTPNGNFSVEGPGPETTLPAASVLTVQYELRDPSYSSTQRGLYVRMPAPAAQFNVSFGQLRIQMPAETVVFNSTNWTSPANTTTNDQLLNETVFPNTGRVADDRGALSSGEMALTSPAPYGSFTVFLRWRWAATPSFGANFTGAWEPNATGVGIVPDQFVQLLSPSTQSPTPGQNVTACLGGPVAGRTFSLHAIQPSPRLDFGNVTRTDPRSGGSPFCLSWTVPTWLEPQTVNVYVWDYYTAPGAPGNITSFLLYVLKINVVAPTSPTPAWLGIPWFEWLEGAGVVGGALVLAGAYQLLRGRSEIRRSLPPTEGSPSPSRPDGLGPIAPPPNGDLPPREPTRPR